MLMHLALLGCLLRSFGLSRVMDPTQTHVSGHAMGTAFYVAPEVARGGQLSKHADVFSWGVMVGAVCWCCLGFLDVPSKLESHGQH